MPKKVSVKPILELRAAGISMRKIESLMHVSRHTISAIYKAADVHSISWDNVKDFDEDKIYEMLFPPVPKMYMTGGESHSVRYMRATTKPLVRATSSDKRASPYRLAS